MHKDKHENSVKLLQEYMSKNKKRNSNLTQSSSRRKIRPLTRF